MKVPPSHSISELLRVVRLLPARTPLAARLPLIGYKTFQEQWINEFEISR
jgi:hypothetical protein